MLLGKKNFATGWLPVFTAVQKFFALLTLLKFLIISAVADAILPTKKLSLIALPILYIFFIVPAVAAPAAAGAPTPVLPTKADPVSRANSSAAIEPIIPSV